MLPHQAASGSDEKIGSGALINETNITDMRRGISELANAKIVVF